jgi:hypothetical protein
MAPIFQASTGQWNTFGSSVTLSWPTHLTNDIGLIVTEIAGNSPTLTPPAGWTAIPGTPVSDTAGLASGSKLHVWWKRAASASEASVATGSTTDHLVARLFTFRGCVTTGNPYNVTTTGAKTTSSTTATVPALVTTVNDTLITMVVGRPSDNAFTFNFDVPVNANLTELDEAGEGATSLGNGGGFVVSYGVKATAGNTGTSTITKLASTTDTYVVLALSPDPSLKILSCNRGLFTGTQPNVFLQKSSTIHGTTRTYSVVGNSLDLSTSGSTPASLDISAGAFTLAGTTTGLLFNRNLIQQLGTFSVVGNNVNLSKSVSLDVNVGTFTYNGTTTGLLFNRNLIQQLGTFSVVGQNLLLQRTARLDITTGSYAVNGFNAALTKQFCIDGITSSYSLVGNSALLQRAARINATSQTYNLVGTATGLLQNRQLVSQTGTFSIAGVQIELIYTPTGATFTLDNQTGTFAVAGILANLNKHSLLSTQTGSYASAGNTLGFIRALAIQSIVGTFSIAGISVGINKQITLNLQIGTYTLSGNTLGFIQALALHSAPGSFSVSGKDAVFSLTKPFSLTTGTYTVSGNTVGVNRFYQLNNQPGNYFVVGSDLDYFSSRNLVTLPLAIVTDFRSVGNFFWYQTTQTIQPVKYKITKRNEFILGRQTHMGRRGI